MGFSGVFVSKSGVFLKTVVATLCHSIIDFLWSLCTQFIIKDALNDHRFIAYVCELPMWMTLSCYWTVFSGVDWFETMLPYFVSGKIVAGTGHGTQIGFPTGWHGLLVCLHLHLLVYNLSCVCSVSPWPHPGHVHNVVDLSVCIILVLRLKRTRKLYLDVRLMVITLITVLSLLCSVLELQLCCLPGRFVTKLK